MSATVEAVDGQVLWAADASRRAGVRLLEFARVAEAFGAPATRLSGDYLDYPALHAWSLRDPGRFWAAVWQYCGIVGEGAPDPTNPGSFLGLDRMAPPDPELGPRWFIGTRLNYAENLLRGRGDQPALVSWDETGRCATLTFDELRRAVARCAAGLRALGVEGGDRVTAYLPNRTEVVVGMLATASVGAVWSSASPDFGVDAVVDRFGQIEPRVLLACTGYRYLGRWNDCRSRLRTIVGRIPSIEHTVLVGQEGDRTVADGLPGGMGWDELCSEPGAELRFERLPFDHPLAILYSSGTTGLPKGIIHGAGGTLLQHLKELVLHTDLHAGDRIFYFTTCGWMMWNWLVSALAVGATLVLYDGAALAPGVRRGSSSRPVRPEILWDMAEAERVTVFGTSAAYLSRIEKEGLDPGRTHSLDALRTILSTGSPLAGRSFDYVYRSIKADVHLASISGGTDIVSCFVLGVPTRPVRRGEIQGAGLGMSVEVWSPEGRRLVNTPGELVCTRPFPSMPIGFWNDPDGARYRRAYFDHYPGVWRHGDWACETEHGGWVIYGRSDATLNPGGVRIGTAEIYRQVERIPEVLECLAVGQEVDGAEPGDTRVLLFVRLRPGASLDRALEDRIRREIREKVSPHHVPQRILEVADLPRTISGKLSEVAVREAIHERPVANRDVLANPESLDFFESLAARTGDG
ncbi:MAG TPA: acetoacetate--CoA ligase [Longimicrobiaceae bacterium]